MFIPNQNPRQRVRENELNLATSLLLLLQKKRNYLSSASACSSIESVYCNIATIYCYHYHNLRDDWGWWCCYNIWERMGLNCIFGNIKVINYFSYLHTTQSLAHSSSGMWCECKVIDWQVSSVVVWWCMQFSMSLLRLCLKFSFYAHSTHHKKEGEFIHPTPIPKYIHQWDDDSYIHNYQLTIITTMWSLK